MVVAIHQPHFLPWLGYLNKVARADAFVLLDTVQYRKNYFQNRARIATPAGEQWLTLPVSAPFGARIRDVTIADGRWRRRVTATLRQGYARAPHFDLHWPALAAAIEAPGESLADVDARLLAVLLEATGLAERPVHLASSLPPAPEEPSERLAALCASIGGSVYLAGRSGHAYLSLEPFAARGIAVEFQALDVERTAFRRADGSRSVGLSSVDALFHLGGAGTLACALAGWSPTRGGVAT